MSGRGSIPDEQGAIRTVVVGSSVPAVDAISVPGDRCWWVLSVLAELVTDPASPGNRRLFLEYSTAGNRIAVVPAVAVQGAGLTRRYCFVDSSRQGGVFMGVVLGEVLPRGVILDDSCLISVYALPLIVDDELSFVRVAVQEWLYRT